MVDKRVEMRMRLFIRRAMPERLRGFEISSRDCLQMIDFFYLPAFRFGIVPGALLVMLRAFAPGLVFGRDSNPNADGLVFVHDRVFPTNLRKVYHKLLSLCRLWMYSLL